MTHGLVLAKDTGAKNRLPEVKSGQANAQNSGLHSEQRFQHLLDVVSSPKAADVPAKGSLHQASFQGDATLASVFKVPLDKETKSAAGRGLKQALSSAASINPRQNHPSISTQPGAVKIQSTETDAASGHGAKNTPDVKNASRSHTDGLSVEHKGQPLFGFFLIPIAGDSQFPLAFHNKTALTEGSATAVQGTEARTSSRTAKSRITAKIEIAAKAETTPRTETAGRTSLRFQTQMLGAFPGRHTTPGNGTSQQQKLVHQGQAGPDGVSVNAVQHEHETGLTIAGLPVQKVVLIANTEQVPKTAQMSALVHGGKIAAPVPAGKHHAKRPISVPAAVGNGSGQQVPTLTGPSFSSSSQAVHIQDTQVYHQFASMIAQQVQTGSQTLHVQVHPQGLGSVTVIVGQQNQGLSIQLSATNPATAAWLQQESAQLTQALQSAGVHLANLQVGVSQQQAQSQTEGRSGQRKGSKTPEPGRIRGVVQEAVQAKPVVSVLDARQSTISLRA